MPLYEYACEVCGGRFERLSSWSAADAQRCPECAEPARRRYLGIRQRRLLRAGERWLNPPLTGVPGQIAPDAFLPK